MAQVDTRVWAKSEGYAEPYPLICHLLDTAAAALVVWDEWLRPGLRRIIADSIAGGDEASARLRVAAAAGLHDVGKSTSVFQCRTMSAQDGSAFSEMFEAAGYDVAPLTVGGAEYAKDSSLRKIARRHEAASLFHLTGGNWPGRLDFVGDSWAAATAGGHHGRFTPQFTMASIGRSGELEREEIKDVLSRAMTGKWGEQATALTSAITGALGISREDLIGGAEDGATATILITGLVIIADWLASDDDSVKTAFTKDPHSAGADPESWLQERTGYFRRTISTTLGVYKGMDDPEGSLLDGNTPTELQAQARTIGRGMWIVTHPTGEGKTAASLIRHSVAAEPGEGVIAALPTRAVTDKMWSTYREAFANTPNAAALLHEFGKLNDFFTKSQSGEGLHRNSWLETSLTGPLAPVAVSTCDQVLLAGLRRTHAPVRLLALANKHVILDEVHTFDHYQNVLLNELLAWFGATDTRVTLLSATLPQEQAAEYVAAYTGGSGADVVPSYPGHIVASRAAVEAEAATPRKSYTLKMNLLEVDAEDQDSVVNAHVDLAAGYAEEPGQRIAVIVNTVERAIRIGSELHDLGLPVVVLHSRMTQAHRMAVTDDLVARAGKKNHAGDGFIVVGTQVIEASLDVDFDRMVTDLAPAASLIQRAGRMWRFSERSGGTWQHKRTRHTLDPVLDVIVPAVDGSIPVQARYPYLLVDLKRTKHALEQYTDGVSVPEDIQDLVDAAVATTNDVEAEVGMLDIEDESSEYAKRVNHARQVVVPFSADHGEDSMLNPDVNYGTLQTLTSVDSADDAATRHIEDETTTVILYDPSGESTWGWHGTIEQIRKARSPEWVRAIRAASLSVRSGATLNHLIGEREYLKAKDGASYALDGCCAVDIRTVSYSDITGLMRR